MAARIKDSEDRLGAFDLTLTHEMRNRVGATLGAAELLETIDRGEQDRRRHAQRRRPRPGGISHRRGSVFALRCPRVALRMTTYHSGCLVA